jgi:hypothetical protein
LVFGRDPHCEVVLEDPGVSGCHARLQRGPNGVEVVDLGSANGVFVDGQRVQRAIVVPGHVIRIGASDITFDLRDSVRAPLQKTLGMGPRPAVPSAMAAAPMLQRPPPKKKGSAGKIVAVLGLVGACLGAGAFFAWRWVETRGVQVAPLAPASQTAANARPGTSNAPALPRAAALPMPNASAGLTPLVFDRNPFEDP